MEVGEIGTKDSALSDTRQLLQLYQQSRDMAARERLVEDNLALVRRLCGRFNHSGQPLEDLIQVGAIGLLKAIEKYDPARGDNFVAFAVPEILGEIKNYFRDHGWGVKIPRKLQRQKVVVERTVERLTQELGRGPTIAEIAQATGFSQEEVYDTFEVDKCGKPLSLDAEYDRDGTGESSSLMDYLASEDAEFEKLIDRISLADALGSLNEREKTIIHLKFYKGLSQTEIAKCLCISQMHVSRLQRNALVKLKRAILD